MTNKEILEAMGRQFMKPFITRKLTWLEIDGTRGTTWLYESDAPQAYFDAVKAREESYERFGEDHPNAEDFDAMVHESLEDYYEGRITNVTTMTGYGARLSAPGYMDCTDWSVFPTEAEAEQYLVDTYGDDVELDSDDGTEVA